MRNVLSALSSDELNQIIISLLNFLIIYDIRLATAEVFDPFDKAALY